MDTNSLYTNQPVPQKLGLLDRFFQGLNSPANQGLLQAGQSMSQTSLMPRPTGLTINQGLLAGTKGYEDTIANQTAMQKQAIELQQLQNQVKYQQQMSSNMMGDSTPISNNSTITNTQNNSAPIGTSSNSMPVASDADGLARWHFNRANLYSAMGNIPGATAAYKEADRYRAISEKNQQLAQMAGSNDTNNYQGGIVPQTPDVANNAGLLNKTQAFIKDQGGFTPGQPSIFNSLLKDKTVGAEAQSQQDYLRNLVQNKISADPVQFQQKVTNLNDSANRASAQAASIAATRENVQNRIDSNPQNRLLDSFIDANRDSNGNDTTSPEQKSAFMRSTKGRQSVEAIALQQAMDEAVKNGKPWGAAESTKFNSDYKANSSGIGSFVGKGQDANTIAAFNKVTDHVALGMQLAKALNNGDIQVINQIKNLWQLKTGVAAPDNIKTLNLFLAPEIEKALNASSAGTGKERENAGNVLSSIKSNPQFEGNLETMTQLLGGQFHALEQKYHNIPLNENGDFMKLLTPRAQAAYNSFKSMDAQIPIGDNKKTYIETRIGANGKKMGKKADGTIEEIK